MKKQNKMNFKKLLRKYLAIKGLDIIVYLEDGKTIELDKNRELVKDEILIYDKNNNVTRIPLANVISVDLFAA